MFLTPITRMLLLLHKQRPITGDFLSIGKQTIRWTYDGAKAFLAAEGIQTRDVTPRYDNTTSARKNGRIDDVTFFAMFCDARVKSLDASPYEGADVIHDLCRLLPLKLYDSADFIADGSCLDNIFNPAQALLCFDRMLRVGGRLFMVNAGTMHPDNATYSALSEEWYQLFLEANGYKDIVVQPWSYDFVMDETWIKGRSLIKGPRYTIDSKHCQICVSATKAKRMAKQIQPMQKQYQVLHGKNT